MSTKVRSRSKINLGLAIGPLRPDGFHRLATLYQTLSLYDTVTVTARAADHPSISLRSTHPQVPLGPENTAWKIVQHVLNELRLRVEVEIFIEKTLPLQGGIGAGSANAAAALLGLEAELGQRFPIPTRFRAAAAAGSDVPLFLLGGAVLGLGRGEEVYPLPDPPSMPCVLALPGVGVSTPRAYRDWDLLHSPSNSPAQGGALTAAEPSSKIEELSRTLAAAFGGPGSSGILSAGEDLAENPLLALVRTGIENDFEKVVFPQHPILGEIKRILAGEPGAADAALYAALSGSGSALFGIYSEDEAAEAALRRLRRQGIPGIVARTLPRSQYWDSMVISDPTPAPRFPGTT